MRKHSGAHANKLGRALLFALLCSACALRPACAGAAAGPTQRRRSAAARPAQTARPAQVISSGPLVVEVSAAGGIKLDGRPAGTLRDTATLTAAVKRVFESRERVLARRPGNAGGIKLPDDGLRDRTVFVKAPAALLYGEVIKAVDAVKTAGASPVGLDVEDVLRTAPPREIRTPAAQGVAPGNEVPAPAAPVNDPDADLTTIKESSVIVALTSGGDTYVRKQRIEKGELESALRTSLSELPGEARFVYVRADKEVSYGQVVEVIDTARRAGAVYIGLVGERKKRD